MENLIFLDTETTGNDPLKDRLCQVCYKVDNRIVNQYFKPPVPVSVKAMSITHVTNKMLKDKESFVGSGTHKELGNLLSSKILVAHNAIFDKAMLEAEGINVPKFICTLRVARHLDKENVIPEYGLQFLRYYLDLDVVGNAHDAEGDVKVLVAVFERLFSKVKSQIKNEDDVISEMVKISSSPTVFRKFNFGKHKDKEIEEVVKTDKGYLEWLLSQKMKDGGTDEDWIHTLKTYLSGDF